MIEICVVTLFPELIASLRHDGIVGRALSENKTKLTCVNPRDFAPGPQHQIDDKPYGGGGGMVIKPEPLAAAIDQACQLLPEAPVLALSPGGAAFSDRMARQLSQKRALILVAGRYQGMDERIYATRIDACISIGDYVLSGGELPAMVVIDALLRYRPQVVGCAKSVQTDSFADSDLLAPPCYTRPANFEGLEVPEVLLSGDHAAISDWRSAESRARTAKWRAQKSLGVLDKLKG